MLQKKQGIKKEACPKKSWPLLTYEKHLPQKYIKLFHMQYLFS